ncbi:MAG: hypothetical protein ACRDNW_25455 [Trebonia sp.]
MTPNARGTTAATRAAASRWISDKAYRDAESELSSAILFGSDQQADLLLCLARRHGIAPDLPALQDRLKQFLNAWLDNPDEYHPESWALREELLDHAHDLLRNRLAADGVASVAAAIRQLGHYFADRGDMSDPIDCHIQASLIGASDQPGRMERRSQSVEANQAGGLTDS